MISLNIVAHPDDDLLFLNPDIAEDMERGGMVYVVYLTMGDDGYAYDEGGENYANQKRRAMMHAYRQHFPQHYLPSHFWIKSNSFRVGDVYGDLYRMWQERERVCETFIGYKMTGRGIVEWMQTKVQREQPDLIRIQDPHCEPAIDHDEPQLDHLDHIYGAKFALEAAKQFPHIPVWAYTGYPLRYCEPNLTPHQIELKTKMWRAYQEQDTSVSGNIWDVALDKCYKERLQ